MSCATCEHAARAGHWPVEHRGTHCRDCHRSWSTREYHCASCCLSFASLVAFDRHRQRGVCVDLADLVDQRTEAGAPVFAAGVVAAGKILRLHAVDGSPGDQGGDV